MFCCLFLLLPSVFVVSFFFWTPYTWRVILQVPPDFYVPDFDEDELDPDERVDRKWNTSGMSHGAHMYMHDTKWGLFTYIGFSSSKLCYRTSYRIEVLCFAEHTQDKQIHRDDEYYEGDNDNDHDDGAHWNFPLWLLLVLFSSRIWGGNSSVDWHLRI
jgi:hypothetical protein